MSSRIPGFYKLQPQARLDALETHLGVDTAGFLSDGLPLETADLMVENVVSTFPLPLSVAINLQLNGQDIAVPMVVEEPSVVAAVSNMARLTRRAGGVFAEADDGVMTGQLQVIPKGDADACAAKLQAELPALIAAATGVHPKLEERGGGLRGVEVRLVTYDEPGFPVERYVVLHVHLDCVDAMGANMVNTLVERLAPLVEGITGERIGLRILTNLADRRLARARVSLRPEHLDPEGGAGAEVAEGIAAAWRFAWADPYRATTHNKGVMNGVDPVAIATGNDWRAIEAGAHAYAARDGQYRPLTRWVVDGEGTLQGSIQLPLQVGTVGGPIRVHPRVQANLALLGSPRARQLAGIMAAVGLIQNLGALRALATEGIQQGHMRMHARSVAAMVGATGAEALAVAARLHSLGDFSEETARRVLAGLRGP